MNHAISINPDKTLVVTVPEGTEVDRVKIRQMNTQKSKLYWRDEVLDQYKWERDIAIQQLKELGYGFGQEPKTGKWINNSPLTMKCDQCGYVISDWKWHESNFCPNCGADMRGEEDE